MNGIFGKIVSSFTELNIVNSNNSKLGKMQGKWRIDNLNSQFYVYMLNKNSKVDKIEKKMNISDGVNSFFVIKNLSIIYIFICIYYLTMAPFRDLIPIKFIERFSKSLFYRIWYFIPTIYIIVC